MNPAPRHDHDQPAIRTERPRIPPAEHPFPTLQAIDHARGTTDAEPFATDLHAAALEPTARQLASEWWPDTAWLTGHIDRRLLDAVVTRLEGEREALRTSVRVFATPAVSAPSDTLVR